MNYRKKVCRSMPNSNPNAPASDRVRRLRRQAHLWVKFARSHSDLPDTYVKKKAGESLRFCVEGGARSFGIPTKLHGTRDLQPALAAVFGLGLNRGHPFEAHLDGDRIVVAVSGMVLGEMARKHSWLVPLMEHDVTFWLLQVTGGDSPSKFYGLNLAVCVGEALEQYYDTWKRTVFPPPALVPLAI